MDDLNDIKGVGWFNNFNPQFPSQLGSKNTQKLLFKMIEINATRIPNSYYPGRPHVGDDANHILTRGKR